jgi:hypothetical protein
METNDIFNIAHLNIGNLVEHRTTKGNITHFYVIGLSDLMLIENNIVKALRTYFPIKISAEILRVFNFEEVGKNIFAKNLDDLNYINYIEVSKRNSEYVVWFWYKGKIIDVPTDSIEYIHQLQNLVKILYKQDLTIK